MATVSLRNINKIYDNKVQAVFDFNLDVEDKEFIVFVGPSGCGKSTTLRMIAGLEEITSGELYIDGQKMNDVLPKDRDIAMVFQSYALYPHMTVYDNMAFGLKLKKMPKEEIDQRVRHAAEILEITPYLKRKPKALSGGQRQRVALGRAIVRNAKVFLMDEPLSNLDAKLRVQMRTEIIKLHESLGATTIYVPHDQTEAMTMASRIVVMKDGYIQQIGSKEKMEEYFNKTATQIRETLRENARDGLTVQKMQQKLVGDIKVTPAEVRRYFKDLPQDSIPYIPTQVEVQIITLQPKIPIAEIEDVKRRLRDYTDRVTKGEIDFSTLARLYSEDKASAIKGGELDFMGRGMLDPAYANVAFSLQDPKKVSKIVESEFGYHIIQLIEKRGDRVNTRHILLRPKVSEKELTEACARLDSIGDDIRQNKFTFDEAASVISQDKDTRNNHGLMVNTNERTGITTSKFQMQDLPQDVAKVVDKMNVGEISRAFTMINEKDGKEVCAIVKLKAKINGHKATIAEDYQDLKEIVMDKRREEMLQKWILNKQKHTYVRIDPNWQKCDFKYPGWVRND